LEQILKIALVCKKYSQENGGMERYTVFLSRELLRAGHQVHIFANVWQEEPGVVIHRVPMLHFSSPMKNLSFAYFSKQALSKARFNVVHSMERIFCPDIFRVSDGINPVQLLQRHPNPAFRRFKAIGPRRLVLGYLERKLFVDGGCKIIMTNSQLVKGQIVEHYKVDTKKIKVIYNGVNTLRFHTGVRERYSTSVRAKYGIGRDELVFLIISNDFKLKRVDLILKAMALLKKKGVRLLVIGNDKQRPYQRWARKNNLEKQVLFLGPKENIERYYAASDIFILPTIYDAFANVCLEAMACGLPVITSVTNGASELIQDGKHGYVLNTQEPDELVRRIEALEPLSERSRMGKDAAARAKRFTMDRHISELLKLYERIRDKDGV